MNVTSLNDLYDLISDKDQLVAYLLINNLIVSETKCRKCKRCMVFNSEELLYRCNRRNASGKCNTKISAYKGKFFENIKIDVKEVLKIIYLYLVLESSETNISIALNISKNSLVDWLNFIREVIVKVYPPS